MADSMFSTLKRSETDTIISHRLARAPRSYRLAVDRVKSKRLGSEETRATGEATGEAKAAVKTGNLFNEENTDGGIAA